MRALVDFMRRFSLQFWAVIIAIALWVQVHGQGEGSLSMDVPLQVQGLDNDVAIVNDLPDHVRITIAGLQSRIKELDAESLFVPVDASGIPAPGVVDRALNVEDIRLPAGLRVEKIQPDHVQLQIDRIARRAVPVKANLELPEGWEAVGLTVEPAQVKLAGPEVWLSTLAEVTTSPIRLPLKPGSFEIKIGVESPAGKAIRLVDPKVQVIVRGMLRQTPAEQFLEEKK